MRVKSAAKKDQGVGQPPGRLVVTEALPRLSRRERRKIATRDALIKAAQEVIAVKGVYLATIEEITERADVAKGSFYQYFRDRDDLLRLLLTRRLEELQGVIDPTPPTGPLAERIRTLIHHHLEYFLRHEDFLLFVHQVRGLIKMKGEETPAVQEAYRHHLRFLAGWLRPDGVKTRANGRAREEGACVLLGILTGFLSHYALLSPLTDLTRDLKRLETALTNACLAFCEERQGIVYP